MTEAGAATHDGGGVRAPLRSGRKGGHEAELRRILGTEALSNERYGELLTYIKKVAR